jgi:hypothetical protein
MTTDVNMASEMWVSLQAILPLLVLCVWACALLLIDLFIIRERKGWTAGLAALGMVVSLVLVIARMGQTVSGFGGMVVVDDFSNFLSSLLLLSGLAGVALAYDYLNRMGIDHGEYYALLLFSIAGMMLMGMSSDLIMVFLALELLSIPLYVLAGIAVPRLNSEEAAIKYFLLGAFSSGFFVFGTALVYGSTGSTSLKTIAEVITAANYDLTLLLAGRLDPGGFEFQGGCGAVPYVDAGCVPGRTLCGNCLHGGGRKNGRVCRPVAHLHPGDAVDFDRHNPGAMGVIRPDHDPGECSRHYTAKYQALVGLFQHCTGRLYPDGAGAVWGP